MIKIFMFIRLKKIKGKNYAYLVSNTWTEKGSRQKVTGYLGKVHSPEKKRAKTLMEFASSEKIEDFFSNNSYTEIISKLVQLELHNHGLEDSFFVLDGRLKTLSGKDAVIQLNQGFLCSETIKKLIEYNAEEDDGYLLANLITYAGLSLEKDHFVLLFEKTKTAKEPKGDFYY
ncbi:hypothetical protein HYU11_05985 [Candidatus Woesearchaeota archaeon]|nr:hypothetical protein [Candidatus Woesearchaeota archaeon]